MFCEDKPNILAASIASLLRSGTSYSQSPFVINANETSKPSAIDPIIVLPATLISSS